MFSGIDGKIAGGVAIDTGSSNDQVVGSFKEFVTPHAGVTLTTSLRLLWATLHTAPVPEHMQKIQLNYSQMQQNGT